MATHFDKLHAKRSAAARVEMAKKAETPKNASAESLREAMKSGRERKKIANPGNPENAKLLDDHKELFAKFMLDRQVDLSKKTRQEDVAKIMNGRIEFLGLIEHVEQIQAMVTPELIDKLIQSESDRGDKNSPFEKLVGLLNGPHVMHDIVQKQLFAMAARSPQNFEELAKSIELLSIHKTSGEHLMAEKAAKVLNKYRLSGEEQKEFEEMLVDKKISSEERDAMLRKKVVSSKGVFGLFQLGADKGLAHLVGEKKRLEQELVSEEMDISAADANLEAQFKVYKEKHDEYLSKFDPSADDEAHDALFKPVKDELDLYEDMEKKLRKMVLKRDSIARKLGGVEDKIPLFEKFSSINEAKELKRSIPQVQEALEKVNEQMKNIAEAVHGAFAGDEEVRALMVKAVRQEYGPVPPLSENPRKTAEDFSPLAQEHQNLADRYVAGQRLAGKTEDREVLLNEYRGEATKRTKEAHAAHRGGFMSFMMRMFTFGGPGREARKATASRTKGLR